MLLLLLLLLLLQLPLRRCRRIVSVLRFLVLNRAIARAYLDDLAVRLAVLFLYLGRRGLGGINCFRQVLEVPYKVAIARLHVQSIVDVELLRSALPQPPLGAYLALRQLDIELFGPLG